MNNSPQLSEWQRIVWLIALGLSLVALTYFTYSAATWLHIVWSMSPYLLRTEWPLVARLSWPCALLYVLSAFCTWRALKVREGALELVLALYLVSAAACWYDVSHDRWLFQVGVAGQGYWDEDRRQNHYPTWWWYNDRCLWKFWM